MSKMTENQTAITTEHFHTSNPYEATFGYSRAIRRGPFILVSGTTSIDPDSGVLRYANGTAGQQARAAFEEALRAVTALGGTPMDVVRVRMFVTSGEDTDDVGNAMKEVLGHVGPAATMIVGTKFVRPEMKVELELDAIVL